MTTTDPWKATEVPPGYDGEFLILRYFDWDSGLDVFRVDRADPRIKIDAEVLNDLRAGRHHPAVTLDGEVLKIRAINRTVIYRIVDYDYDRRAYLAEWPD